MESNDTKQNVKANIQDTEDFILDQQHMIFAVSFTRTKYGKIQHDNGFCQCCVFHIVSLNSVVGYCWHFESSFASSVDVHCRFRFRFSMGGFPKWHRKFLWLSAAVGPFLVWAWPLGTPVNVVLVWI